MPTLVPFRLPGQQAEGAVAGAKVGGYRPHIWTERNFLKKSEVFG